MVSMPVSWCRAAAAEKSVLIPSMNAMMLIRGVASGVFLLLAQLLDQFVGGDMHPIY